MKRERRYEINVQYINKYIADNWITRKEFAERCGISANSLSRILNKKVMPKPSTMFKIAQLLGVHIPELYKKIETVETVKEE